jgi:hypothetical protein
LTSFHLLKNLRLAGRWSLPPASSARPLSKLESLLLDRLTTPSSESIFDLVELLPSLKCLSFCVRECPMRISHLTRLCTLTILQEAPMTNSIISSIKLLTQLESLQLSSADSRDVQYDELTTLTNLVSLEISPRLYQGSIQFLREFTKLTHL